MVGQPSEYSVANIGSKVISATCRPGGPVTSDSFEQSAGVDHSGVDAGTGGVVAGGRILPVLTGFQPVCGLGPGFGSGAGSGTIPDTTPGDVSCGDSQRGIRPCLEP